MKDEFFRYKKLPDRAAQKIITFGYKTHDSNRPKRGVTQTKIFFNLDRQLFSKKIK
jgi:hypothetical protein